MSEANDKPYGGIARNIPISDRIEQLGKAKREKPDLVAEFEKRIVEAQRRLRDAAIKHYFEALK